MTEPVKPSLAKPNPLIVPVELRQLFDNWRALTHYVPGH